MTNTTNTSKSSSNKIATMEDFRKALKTKKYFSVELLDNNSINYDIVKKALKSFNRNYGIKSNGVGYYEYIGNMPNYADGDCVIGFNNVLKTGVIWCDQDLFIDKTLRYWLTDDHGKRTGDYVDFDIIVTVMTKIDYDRATTSRATTEKKAEEKTVKKTSAKKATTAKKSGKKAVKATNADKNKTKIDNKKAENNNEKTEEKEMNKQ